MESFLFGQVYMCVSARLCGLQEIHVLDYISVIFLSTKISTKIKVNYIAITLYYKAWHQTRRNLFHYVLVNVFESKDTKKCICLRRTYLNVRINNLMKA